MRLLILVLSIFSTSYLSAQPSEKLVPIVCSKYLINQQEVQELTSIFHIYQGSNPKRDNAEDVEVYSVAPTWEWVVKDYANCKSKQYVDCMCAVSLTPAETMNFKIVKDISNLDPALYKTTKLKYKLSNLPVTKVPVICHERKQDVKGLIIKKLEQDGYLSFTPVEGNAYDMYFEAQLMDYRVRHGLSTDYVWAMDVLEYMNIDIKDKPKVIIGAPMLFAGLGNRCYGKYASKKHERSFIQELKYPIYLGTDSMVQTEWLHISSNLPYVGREYTMTESNKYIACNVLLEDQNYESIEVFLRGDDIPAADISYKTIYKELKNPKSKEQWIEIVCPDLITDSLVEEIQNELVKRKYLAQGAFRVGGYDRTTKAAVLSFQKAKKIPHGPVSLKTLKALNVKVPKK